MARAGRAHLGHQFAQLAALFRYHAARLDQVGQVHLRGGEGVVEHLSRHVRIDRLQARLAHAAAADLQVEADPDFARHRVPGARLIRVSDEDLCGCCRCADTGATLHAGGEWWTAPAPAVAVVDTVGAGHASLAGVLSSIMTRPERAQDAHLWQAIVAGVAACMVQGAAPPRQEAVARLLACAEGT